MTDHAPMKLEKYQIIRLNTYVIRVAKECTSCEYLPIDTNFVSILLLVSVLFSRTF